MTAGMANAGPETSLRPVARSVADLVLEQTGTIAPPARDADASRAADRSSGPRQSLRPEVRPAKVQRAARDRQRLRERGAVCGDPDIQGDLIGPVVSGKSGCGLEEAVRVRSVSGVELSQRSVMDCPTARALKTWVDESAKPALAGKGGGLARLRVAAHYVCRTRNNQPGAKVSEHGKGRAIDISAFRLRDGTLITVRNGWTGKDTAGPLRQMHRGACGPFGTVLGPEADRFHLDHFHFDTANHRSGPVCR